MTHFQKIFTLACMSYISILLMILRTIRTKLLGKNQNVSVFVPLTNFHFRVAFTHVSQWNYSASRRCECEWVCVHSDKENSEKWVVKQSLGNAHQIFMVPNKLTAILASRCIVVSVVAIQFMHRNTLHNVFVSKTCRYCVVGLMEFYSHVEEAYCLWLEELR